jgi:ribosomal protein L37AE/L43A
MSELTRQSNLQERPEDAARRFARESLQWWTCSGCGSEFEIGLGPLRVLYPDLAAVRDA